MMVAAVQKRSLETRRMLYCMAPATLRHSLGFRQVGSVFACVLMPCEKTGEPKVYVNSVRIARRREHTWSARHALASVLEPGETDAFLPAGRHVSECARASHARAPRRHRRGPEQRGGAAAPQGHWRRPAFLQTTAAMCLPHASGSQASQVRQPVLSKEPLHPSQPTFSHEGPSTCARGATPCPCRRTAVRLARSKGQARRAATKHAAPAPTRARGSPSCRWGR